MIDRIPAVPLKRHAELVGISRNSLHYRPKPISERDRELMPRLNELHLEKPFMGVRMLCDQLDRLVIKAGRWHVGNLMKRMGVTSVYREPSTSKKHPGHRIPPYLLRGLTIYLTKQVWALDTTSIPWLWNSSTRPQYWAGATPSRTTFLSSGYGVP